MPTKTYRVRAGKHYERVGDANIRYESGEFVESDRPLMKLHPNKFETVKGETDSHAEEKAAAKDSIVEIGGPPVRGMPNKRTRRPMGPEETPNTKSEIEEVRDAIEEDDTEDEQITDHQMNSDPKKRKARPGRDETEGDDEAAKQDKVKIKAGKKFGGKKIRPAVISKDEEESDDEDEEEEEEDLEADEDEDEEEESATDEEEDADEEEEEADEEEEDADEEDDEEEVEKAKSKKADAKAKKKKADAKKEKVKKKKSKKKKEEDE